MTDDEKVYLLAEASGLKELLDSGLRPLMKKVSEARAVLYLFDAAYGMGFAACQHMLATGIDVTKLAPNKLSLVEDPLNPDPDIPKVI